MPTANETELLGLLGDLLVSEQRPLSFAEIVAAHPLGERSVRTLLANLTRPSYFDARPLISGGTHTDGSLYGASRGLDRNAWVEKTAEGSYRLSEWGWYAYFRYRAAVESGHFGTSHETLQAQAREQVLTFGGTPTFISTPEDEN
jgi:hypothetical protein